MPKYCPEPNDPDSICVDIPPLYIIPPEKWPPDPWWSPGIFLRIRVFLVSALVGPYPNPWRRSAALVPQETERDLAILSTIHAWSQDLGPDLRGPVQDSVRGAAERMRLPRGAAVRF